MNIADKMCELIRILKSGKQLEGVRFPDLTPECEEMWHEHYAIVVNFLWETGNFFEPTPYFDEAQFLVDLKELIVNHFENAVIRKNMAGQLTQEEEYPIGTVVINFHLSSGELEVYREGMTKEFFDKLEEQYEVAAEALQEPGPRLSLEELENGEENQEGG